MTELLRKAFEIARQLPPEEQDKLARWLIEELEEEARWAESFARSQDALSNLADQALEDLTEGRTERLDSLPAWHREVLDQRIAAADADPDSFTSADDAVARVRSKLRRR